MDQNTVIILLVVLFFVAVGIIGIPKYIKLRKKRILDEQNKDVEAKDIISTAKQFLKDNGIKGTTITRTKVYEIKKEKSVNDSYYLYFEYKILSTKEIVEDVIEVTFIRKRIKKRKQKDDLKVIKNSAPVLVNKKEIMEMVKNT